MALNWLILLSLIWLAWAFLCRWLTTGPRPDVWTGLAWLAMWLYARLWHRLRVEGSANVPRGVRPGPLLVVANHTAGIDPLLVQAACPFFIRWMMARDMMVDRHDGLWRWADVIPVERRGRDTTSAKEAIAHLRRGGVLGVFPEGGIERPERMLRPFMPGVGILIARTGARVLPVLIDGTPQVGSVWQSLLRRSRSRVRVEAAIDYSQSGLSAGEITKDLERRYLEWTGWALNPGDPREDVGE